MFPPTTLATQPISRNAPDRRGMAAIQAVLLVALSAIMLTGVLRYFESENGIAGLTKGRVTELLAYSPSGGGGSTGGGSGGPIEVVPRPGSGGAGSTNPSDRDSNEGGNGGNGGAGENGGGGNQPDDDGRVDPALEGLLFDIAKEEMTARAKQVVETLEQEVRSKMGNNYDPVGLEELLVDNDFEMRRNVVKNVGVMMSAMGAVDGLTSAERDIRRLVEQGRYEEAWSKTWSAPAKFTAEAVLESKHVAAVLDRLPPKVRTAIAVTAPRAVESAIGAAASGTWSTVGKKINDKLWAWHDKGYVPRPRIPRDHDFES